MRHMMLSDDLMEIRGAKSEIGARLYAQMETGRITESVLYVAVGVYQVVLR